MKTQPNEETSGNPPPPPHVPYIDEDRVRLEGDTGALADAVRASRFRKQGVFTSPRPGGKLVAIRFRGGDRLENRAFIALLLWLNEQGVHFGYDYKQGMDPEGLMSTLQERGLLSGPFRNIYWRGTDTWYSREIRPGKDPGDGC